MQKALLLSIDFRYSTIEVPHNILSESVDVCLCQSLSHQSHMIKTLLRTFWTAASTFFLPRKKLVRTGCESNFLSFNGQHSTFSRRTDLRNLRKRSKRICQGRY